MELENVKGDSPDSRRQVLHIISRRQTIVSNCSVCVFTQSEYSVCRPWFWQGTHERGRGVVDSCFGAISYQLAIAQLEFPGPHGTSSNANNIATGHSENSRNKPWQVTVNKGPGCIQTSPVVWLFTLTVPLLPRCPIQDTPRHSVPLIQATTYKNSICHMRCFRPGEMGGKRIIAIKIKSSLFKKKCVCVHVSVCLCLSECVFMCEYGLSMTCVKHNLCCETFPSTQFQTRQTLCFPAAHQASWPSSFRGTRRLHCPSHQWLRNDYRHFQYTFVSVLIFKIGSSLLPTEPSPQPQIFLLKQKIFIATRTSGSFLHPLPR